MGSTIWWLADGGAFFAGLVLASAGLLLLLLQWGATKIRAAIAGAVLAGLLLATLSSAPQPAWLFLLWGASATVALPLLLFAESGEKLRRASRCALALAVTLSAVLCAAELFHRFSPAIPRPADGTVYIIGDSLSAGIRDSDRTWPALLGEQTGLQVINLARPGATAGSAMSQAREILEGSSLVLVEIGGNDVLVRHLEPRFRSELDALLGEVKRRAASVVLFELPLPPFHDDFGRAQRSLARKHGAILLPKTMLSAALALEGGTLDGIHLSARGHDALARAVARLLGGPEKAVEP